MDLRNLSSSQPPSLFEAVGLPSGSPAWREDPFARLLADRLATCWTGLGSKAARSQVKVILLDQNLLGPTLPAEIFSGAVLLGPVVGLVKTAWKVGGYHGRM